MIIQVKHKEQGKHLQTEYNCPLCRSAIAIADVNVATDLALCRACGKTSAFSAITGAAEISLDSLSHPPRHVHVEKDFQIGTVIRYYKFSSALYFLIPFTALWSGFSMWGIYGRQISRGEFDLGRSLFGLPFLAGTLFLLAVIAILLLGKWVITLNNGKGIVFFGMGTLGCTRHFTYNRDTRVSLKATTYKVNDVPQMGIHVQNDTNEFVFGSTLAAEAKQYIAASIMQELATAPIANF